jgi:HK97 family phage major capsid protein
MMLNSLGQPLYPTVNVNGGTLQGLPVIASENLPGTGGSPTDGYPIILLKQRDILLADDGQVTIDASREASLQMDSTPDSPTTGSTNLVSLWQQNMLGIRAEKEINWVKRRSTSVGFIQNAKYQ